MKKTQNKTHKKTTTKKKKKKTNKQKKPQFTSSSPKTSRSEVFSHWNAQEEQKEHKKLEADTPNDFPKTKQHLEHQRVLLGK